MHDDYYFVNQDGAKSSDFCIYLEEYPSVKMGQEKYEKKTVPGRGNVYYRTGTYSDTEIDVLIDVNVIGSRARRTDVYLDARRFLRSCRTISFCDAPDYFYKVKYADLGGVDQYVEDAGDFDVTYICEPGAFLQVGTLEYDPANVLLNPYDISHPEYRITGEGMCTLTVNGKTMIANVGQNLTINTELMIAYRLDGTIQNTEVTGNYENLYLQRGTNTISITEGFYLKIIPNWRCL